MLGLYVPQQPDNDDVDSLIMQLARQEDCPCEGLRAMPA
jgi:hypothetical protein